MWWHKLSQGMTVAAGTVFSSGALCSLSDVTAPWIVPGDEVTIDAGSARDIALGRWRNGNEVVVR
jgi:2-keto-4-pentenoate hydratase/2-oxohepta-3-ene-1,7-dioic acid hydratase in catechol pathway